MDDPGYHSDQHHHPRRWTTLHDLRIAKKIWILNVIKTIIYKIKMYHCLDSLYQPHLFCVMKYRRERYVTNGDTKVCRSLYL